MIHAFQAFELFLTWAVHDAALGFYATLSLTQTRMTKFGLAKDRKPRNKATASFPTLWNTTTAAKP